MGQSIPLVCQDWANTKAVYRFFSNERVNEADILCGHFEATRGRVAATEGPILVLHDTTEFSFKREKPDLIGFTGKTAGRTQCGILMHSSLAVTTEGLPLGLSAIKFWTRKKFKGTTALKRKINPTRVPIEQKESIRWLENLRQSTDLLAAPGRCVHIGDRESDIYELFCLAEEVGTHFLVRTCVDRLAEDGNHTIADEMDEVTIKGLHRIKVKDDKGDPDDAVLEIRYRKIRVLPPIGKQTKYPALTLTVIHAQERGRPKRRKKIEWKLLTDLPVQCTHPASTPGRRGGLPRRSGSSRFGLLGRLPIPREQVGDFVDGVIRKPGQHVSEPGLRINVVHLAGFDQGIDSGGTIAASI
ncbi:hypothetical protein ACVIHI_008515 [Bradyrhizobium sp. USDA 4524]|nr:hypothetical protein [Bradyrhizobium sp. USDA 4538]MCP1907342.1 hypothetical protein [Bradyrhizobium sp. USDA 4537]MCP1985128.1 hypothetical protein [Bradyrhizobium sp. USDA 4539]